MGQIKNIKLHIVTDIKKMSMDSEIEENEAEMDAEVEEFVGDDTEEDDEEEDIAEEDEMGDKTSGENGKENTESEIYLPGKPMEEGEELTFDKSAYVMYHAATTGAPCLSFDIIPDDDSQIQTEFPFNCDIVCGTQMPGKPNLLLLMKMMNLSKMEEEDSDSEDSYIEEEDRQPKLYTLSIKHTGDVNRIRYTKLGTKRLAATWSSVGNVDLWDLTPHFETLNNNRIRDQHQTVADNVKPLYSFSGHQVEGYAMDWSPTVPGRLATGSCNKNIHIWQPNEGASSWHVDQRPLNAHTASVEDLQWSPNERNVFASCSVDKSIRIWDANLVGSKANMLTVPTAHDADVNVISWNRNDPFLVSGGDDGVVKVWDLRQIKNNTPVATFKHHSAPITSVEWHPTDSSVFTASGSDNQITIWDLAVERDSENVDPSLKDIPPQLLFIHMGQTDIKELHWCKKMPGVIISTAASGFNVFRTISV